MGEFAEDLINGSMEVDGYPPNIWVPIEAEFEVSIIHRKTRNTHWTGTVWANSKRDAQYQFRKKYAHIRSQYTHEYGLGIRRIPDSDI